MGPYLVFDKSFLESLTADEAVWLDNYFMNNITPLFYIETLADLEKEKKKGKVARTPQELVGEIASKSPNMGAVSAVHHTRLVIGDMLGHEASWKYHRPIVGGGEYKKLPDGKITIDFKQFPEFAALDRWKAGDFQTIEEQIARDWREALSNLTFETFIEKAVSLVPEGEKLSSEKDVYNLVNRLVSSRYNQFIHFALDFLEVPEKARGAIKKRWYATRPKPFNEFAPYAAHVLKVDLFFYICLSKSFISKERPTNKIDIAYLYYLPFSMVFVSSDKLHRRIVPLFLEEDQVFVFGDELKSDLKKINDHFSAIPEEIKKRGVYKFAVYPPHDIETLVGKLHDQFLKPWRENAKNQFEKAMEPSQKNSELVESLTEKQESKTPYFGPPIDSDKADSMVLTRKIPAKRGNWVLFPPEVIDAAREK